MARAPDAYFEGGWPQLLTLYARGVGALLWSAVSVRLRIGQKDDPQPHSQVMLYVAAYVPSPWLQPPVDLV